VLHSSRFRVAISLAVAGAGLAAMLVVTSMAGATHTRPKTASPTTSALVVAYDPCTSPTTGHAPHFVGGSCAPVPTSPHLRVGTPDANGIAAGLAGFAKLKVVPGDIEISASIPDVHCSAMGGPPAACPHGPFPGAYAGSVGLHYLLRITDHCNGPLPGPPACPAPPGTAATVQDLPYLTEVPCGPAPAPPAGSTCSISTTFNALTPGAIVAGMRMNIRTHEVHVTDGGGDGDAGTVDPAQRRFLYEGVFVP
jgi:hypothetical protein